jgi:hypothetical protein
MAEGWWRYDTRGWMNVIEFYDYLRWSGVWGCRNIFFPILRRSMKLSNEEGVALLTTQKKGKGRTWRLIIRNLSLSFPCFLSQGVCEVIKHCLIKTLRHTLLNWIPYHSRRVELLVNLNENSYHIRFYFVIKFYHFLRVLIFLAERALKCVIILEMLHVWDGEEINFDDDEKIWQCWRKFRAWKVDGKVTKVGGKLLWKETKSRQVFGRFGHFSTFQKYKRKRRRKKRKRRRI